MRVAWELEQHEGNFFSLFAVVWFITGQVCCLYMLAGPHSQASKMPLVLVANLQWKDASLVAESGVVEEYSSCRDSRLKIIIPLRPICGEVGKQNDAVIMLMNCAGALRWVGVFTISSPSKGT